MDQKLIDRVAAALRLDLGVFDEVALDEAASGQALRVVLLAGISNGLALVPRIGVVGILAGVGTGLLSWLLWAAVIWLTGTLLSHRRQGRSLLRPLGFANAPSFFLILGVMPTLGALIRIVIVVWLLATTVCAVQAVFEATRARATWISLAAFVIYLGLGLASRYLASL